MLPRVAVLERGLDTGETLHLCAGLGTGKLQGVAARLPAELARRRAFNVNLQRHRFGYPPVLNRCNQWSGTGLNVSTAQVLLPAGVSEMVRHEVPKTL